MSWASLGLASSMPSPKKPKSPKKPTGRAPGKTTATPAAQCAWSWQRFRCRPEPGCRLTLGAHWPRCDGKTSSIGTPEKSDVDAVHITINNVTISGDMSALCCSLLLLAPLMYIGRAWSRRRRMAAVPTKSKLSPRPRRRQTAAVSTAAVSTKSKTAPRLEEVAEPESSNNRTHKVYPWSPAAEHAAAAEEVDRRWRLVREEAAKIATLSPASPSRSRLPLLASRLPSFSDLTKDLTKPPELSAPVAVQHDAPVPPCLSGCTHRWVKEHLPPLLAAKQVRAFSVHSSIYLVHAWYVHSTCTVSRSTRPSKSRGGAVAPACIAYAWCVGCICMVRALHMQEPRWGCRYCGAEMLTQGGRHPTDPAADAVAAPQRSSAPAVISTPRSQRKSAPPSPASGMLPIGSPSLVSPSSGGGEVRPRSAALKLYGSRQRLPIGSPHHPSRRQSAPSPFAYTPN